MATDLQRAAPRLHYVCGECGAEAPKWQGRCPACEAWNSLSEDVVRVSGRRRAGRTSAAITTALTAVMAVGPRVQPTGSCEIDRVLGGGIVPGSVVLLGGDPGIGKSTIALQVSNSCGDEVSPALYCTGEESLEQLALRARRLGCTGARVRLLAESDVDTVIATIEAERPSLVRDRLGPDAPRRRHAGPTRERLAGSSRCPAHERRRRRHRGARAARRARHQGGSDRGAAHPRAHGRRGALPRGRAPRRAPDAPRHQEPLRRDRRGGPPEHGARRDARPRRHRAGGCSTRRRSASRAACSRSPATGSGRWRWRCRRWPSPRPSSYRDGRSPGSISTACISCSR